MKIDMILPQRKGDEVMVKLVIRAAVLVVILSMVVAPVAVVPVPG